MITACAILSSGKRFEIIRDIILPSCQKQGFDELLIVGPYPYGCPGVRHLDLQPIWNNAADGLAQRDVTVVATWADAIIYLCDDHKLDPEFGEILRRKYNEPSWDVLVPSRFTVRGDERIALNMGMEDRTPNSSYCAGHAGVFRRYMLRQVPWLLAPHGPCWDLWHSRMLSEHGAIFKVAEDLLIFDVEPGAEPWR